MAIAAFFGVLSAIALGGTILEYRYSRARGLDWHEPSDTMANLNLAAGQVLLGTVLAGLTIGVYAAIELHALVDVPTALGTPVALLLGYLLAEFLQYWNHRLAHVWNLWSWGHLTHHTSSHMNLSTGVRVSWFFRLYAWSASIPLALLGFDPLHFIFFQALMNVGNLFMHTRFDLPRGPWDWIFITPQAHRLHHAKDPAYFGNYGATLIIFDRLFGTYKQVAPGTVLEWGSEHNTDESDPLRLNFSPLLDLWETSKATGVPFWRLLLGTAPATHAAKRLPVAMGDARLRWWSFVPIAAIAVVLNQVHPHLDAASHAAALATGLVLVLAFGASLQPAPAQEMHRAK